MFACLILFGLLIETFPRGAEVTSVESTSDLNPVVAESFDSLRRDADHCDSEVSWLLQRSPEREQLQGKFRTPNETSTSSHSQVERTPVVFDNKHVAEAWSFASFSNFTSSVHLAMQGSLLEVRSASHHGEVYAAKMHAFFKSVVDSDDSKFFIISGVLFFLSMAILSAFVLQDVVRGEVWPESQRQSFPDSRSEKKKTKIPSWPACSPAVKEDSMPVISTLMLTNSGDLPLVVPLQSIEAGREWSVDIQSAISGKTLLTAHLKQGGDLKATSCVEVWSAGPHKKLLASIDPLLVISDEEARCFGKLIRLEDQYVLEETNGREPRWSIGAELDGSISVVWLPKGTHSHPSLPFLKRSRAKAGVQEAHSNKGPVIASVAIESNESPHLQLVSISGVDDVLVLLTTLGLIAFDGVFDICPTVSRLQ